MRPFIAWLLGWVEISALPGRHNRSFPYLSIYVDYSTTVSAAIAVQRDVNTDRSVGGGGGVKAPTVPLSSASGVQLATMTLRVFCISLYMYVCLVPVSVRWFGASE